MINIVNSCMLYMKIVKKVNPKNYDYKEKYFFCFFNFISI